MNDDLSTPEERLALLEKKVDRIVEILGIRSFNTEPAPQKIILSTRDELPPPLPKQEKYEIPKPKSSGATVNLLPLLAVICFGLAGIFIVKLALDSGWLTPDRQWGLLSLFGISLVSVSLFFEKIERDYRSFLGAAGVIVLYFAAYSSSIYFDLFTPEISIGLGAVVSFLCFYMFHYFKSDLFIMICAIGTYISPVLLDKETDIIQLSGFFLIWAGLFSSVAIYLRSRTLTLLASYLGLGVFTYLNSGVYDHEFLRTVIMIHCMQFVIFATGVYSYSIRNKSNLAKNEAMAYLPILLFFYGTTYYFLNLLNPLIAPYISLGFAAFIFLLYWSASKKITELESQNLIYSFLSVVIFHSGYIELMPAKGKVWLLPLIILAIYVSEQKESFQKIAPALKTMFTVIAVIEFFTLCFDLISNANLLNVVPAFATIILGFLYHTKSGKHVKNKEALFLALLHIISVLALYRLAFDYGSLAVSVLWGAYSVLILVFGYLKKNAIVAKSSLLVLMVTAVKALVYDAGQASSGARIGSLILTGAILYGAGYLFQKINKWTTT